MDRTAGEPTEMKLDSSGRSTHNAAVCAVVGPSRDKMVGVKPSSTPAEAKLALTDSVRLARMQSYPMQGQY